MWSWLGFSKMSSQKRKAVIACRASVEAERALGFWPVDDVDAVCGSGESLVTECDRVKIFGVAIGESEAGSGISLVGLFFPDWSPWLPYMADGAAHYAEKVGDTQQKVCCVKLISNLVKKQQKKQNKTTKNENRKKMLQSIVLRNKI